MFLTIFAFPNLRTLEKNRINADNTAVSKERKKKVNFQIKVSRIRLMSPAERCVYTCIHNDT